MDEIKNVVVEQKDIYNIIKYFNDYFLKMKEIFDATDSFVNEEEQRYAEWSKVRYDDNFTGEKEFKRELFANKREVATISLDVSYIDGSTLNGKSVDDFLASLSTIQFDKIESLTINMNISYKLKYKADDYGYDPTNRVSQDVYIKFREDSIYYNISGEHCDSVVTDHKTFVLDTFNNLEPRFSPLITKRKKIKYISTMYIAFILSAILVSAAAVLIDRYVTIFELGSLKFAFIPLYAVFGLFLNTIVPAARLSKLYSLIVPKQRVEYDTYKKENIKVDNIQDFVSYPEVQIGKSAKKANVRQDIVKIYKGSKPKNIICFVLGLAIVSAVVLLLV